MAQRNLGVPSGLVKTKFYRTCYKVLTMKTNKRPLAGQSFAFLAAMLSVSVLAPEAAKASSVCLNRQIKTLDFRAPTLTSGLPLLPGAIYTFVNVTPGVDARVSIDAISVGASLATIDNDAGLIANFQPELAGTNARSVDFTFTFVNAGTTTPIAGDFAASAIDIDGDSASLREYAEFSNAFSVYAFNNPTNLAVNASGPSVATNTRFEAITSANAPGIDPTAYANIAEFLYTGTSTFKYRIGTLGTGATTRLTSLDFSCPSLPSTVTTTNATQDFGDAPASYGNPVHDIVAGVRLGATNTAEAARYNSPTASGDSGDDGVTIAPLYQAQTGTATATVSGTGGFLNAWIDWNGNGVFTDAGEQVAVDVTDNSAGDINPATGTIKISFPVPATATITPTFARFRWSLQSGLNADTLIAPNGEVEDYQITINGRAIMQVGKTSAPYLTSGAGQFNIPGNDVIYTITSTNTGQGQTTTDSLFVVDALPPQVEFYNGDIDDAGPATANVIFSQSGASLSFNPAVDMKYSNAAAAPTSFAACTYTPVVGYDPAVKYVCFNPKGPLLAGTPNPNFNFQIRTRIK